MPRRSRVAAWTVLVLALVVVAGCGTILKPPEFNDLLAESNRDLAKSAKGFNAEMTKLAGDVMPSTNQLRQQVATMRSTLADVRERLVGLKPPAGSKTGKEFLDRYKEFLDGQEDLLRIAEQMIAVAEDEKVGDLSERWKRVSELQASIEPEEKKTREPLTEVQKRFMEEHNLQSVGTRFNFQK